MRHWLAFAAVLLPLATAAQQQFTVSAASSLTDAFKAIGQRFEAANPGVKVRFNFAASGVLLQQISQGAPVDVLATADAETLDRAATQRLVDTTTRRDFAANLLVLVEPARSGVGIRTLDDLAKPAVRRIAIGKPASAPAGRYTRQALEHAKLWTALTPKFVHADNVRQVLHYVARGEVEAGFVYRTDAALAPGQVRIALTASGHAPITYPAAVVAASRQPALAREFVAFLVSDAAQQVLANHGFVRP